MNETLAISTEHEEGVELNVQIGRHVPGDFAGDVFDDRSELDGRPLGRAAASPSEYARA